MVLECDIRTGVSEWQYNNFTKFCYVSNSNKSHTNLKYGSNIVKTVAKVALRNPFSTYCNNFLEIIDQCVQFNIKECHSLILKSWHYSITNEMSSNINVLKDMIDIRDGMKECAYLDGMMLMI